VVVVVVVLVVVAVVVVVVAVVVVAVVAVVPPAAAAAAAAAAAVLPQCEEARAILTCARGWRGCGKLCLYAGEDVPLCCGKLCLYAPRRLKEPRSIVISESGSMT